jgi:hypothetical protein
MLMILKLIRAGLKESDLIDLQNRITLLTCKTQPSTQGLVALMMFLSTVTIRVGVQPKDRLSLTLKKSENFRTLTTPLYIASQVGD